MRSAYRTPEELEEAIVRMREGIPRQISLDAFASWRKRSERGIDGGGGYFG
jgi:hypothetical protein